MFAAVNLAMASGMQQGKIMEPVRTTSHFPDHVMSMPSGFRADGIATDLTTATLSLPEYPVPSVEGFLHAALVAPLEVQFPSCIEWIGVSSDFDVPRNWDAS